MSAFSRMKNKVVKTCKKGKGLVRKLYRGLLQRKRYLAYREKLPVNKNVVLLESQHGRSLDGNVYAVLEELCKNSAYNGFTLYVSAEAANCAWEIRWWPLATHWAN